jgi:hypothetical protein
MDITLPLDQMTVNEKLRAIEQIWEDLCRNEAAVPCPEWHRDVLEARQARLAGGTERLADWEDSKRRIRESVR